MDKWIVGAIEVSKFEDEVFESKDVEASIRFCITKIESRLKLEGVAADAIAGLKVSNATYSEAIDLLKRRFGDDQVIISTHMDKLLNIAAVESMNDAKILREIEGVNEKTNAIKGSEKKNDALEVSPHQSTTNMHTNTRNSVLLQTARVPVKTPQKQNVSTVRLVFDSGSQNTYVTSDLKNALSLPVIGKDKMFIKTFGKVSPKFTTCEIVQLGIVCKDGTEIMVQAYVVPVICTPISNQLLSTAIEKYEHLRGLDLADYCDGDEPIERWKFWLEWIIIGISLEVM
eukprot:gene11143-20028_t